jgi:hypothetical protein
LSDTATAKKFDSELMGLSLQDQIDFLKHMIGTVVQGKKVALVICGTAGVGKSRTVKEILASEKGSRKVIWDSGLIKKEEDLYRFFYKYRDKENIIVFDDTPIIEVKQFRALLLSALAPEHKRPISFRTEKFVDPNSLASLDTKKIPDSFIFEASVIITTNIPKRKMDGAIVSRTSPIELNVEKSDVIDSLRVNLATIIKEFKDFGNVSLEEATDVLNFIEEHLGHIDHIDFRLFRDCLAIRAVIPPSPLWKKFILMTLQNYR